MEQYSDEDKKKFKKIRPIISKELKKEGKTIRELMETFPKVNFDCDPAMEDDRFQKKWFQLQLIEDIICKKLKMNFEDFGRKRSHNRLSSMIRKEMTYFRKHGKIIDLKFGGKSGTWRKTSQVEEQAIVELNIKKEYSFLLNNQNYQKAKEIQFKNNILIQYKKCLLCRDTVKLKPMHIISLDVMQDIDSKNYFNPSNGLLFCPLCNHCFEKKIVEINDDYSIKINDKNPNPKHISVHLKKIKKSKKIYTNKLKPEKKYLRLKKHLNCN
jgi:hypothetical protein